MSAFLLAVRCMGTAVLAVATVAAARRASADFSFGSGTRSGVERAVRLEPGSAAYSIALAAWQDAAREDSIPELRRAAAIAPLDERVIQKLALALELNGQTAEAEQQFLRAAARSRKFDPRWALANFYFRQNRPAEFRRWTREALAMSYSNPSPLFDLAWAMAPEAGLPAEDLPPRRDVRLASGTYLVQHRRFELAGRVTQELAGGSEPEALALADALAEDYRLDRAERIAPGHATRWKGSRAHFSDGAWRIQLDGSQPEHEELLARLALANPRRTRLVWTIRTSLTSPAGLLTSSGLRWRISRWTPDRAVIAESEEIAVSGEGGGILDFEPPAEGEGIRISLEYRRPSGSMRAEGSIAIPGAELVPRP